MPQKTTTIPRTVAHSTAHAKTIWRKAHDRAVETYGDTKTAHRVAYAALKHQYAKQGNRWVRKSKKPSDSRATRSSASSMGRTIGNISVAGRRVLRTTKRIATRHLKGARRDLRGVFRHKRS